MNIDTSNLFCNYLDTVRSQKADTEKRSALRIEDAISSVVSDFVARKLDPHIDIPEDVKAKKKKCVFTVRRPSLIFGPDPKLFYRTFSRKLFKYPIFAFQLCFSCLRHHYFDKNELNVTLQV